MDFIPSKSKIQPDEPFKVSVMKPQIKPTLPHKHAHYFELILLSEGAGIHTVDGQEIEVRPPMAFFLRPGQVHCWDFTKIPQGFVVLFKEESLLSLSGGEAYQWSTILDLPVFLSLTNHAELFVLAELFFNDFKEGNRDATIFSAFLWILLRKLRVSVGEMAYTVHAEQTLAYQFKQLVERYFLEEKEVKTYADRMGITPKKLTTICKKGLGKLPSDVIRERIIREAKNQLTYTHLSVAEVGYVLHFNDPSHFVKFFRQHTSLTPGQYRDLL